MTIAVHIEPLSRGKGSILKKSILLLAAQHPDDHFIFFINKGDKSLLQNKNCTPALISPSIKNNLLLYYWYNFKLPALLNRYNADAFINESPVCSFRADIPQYTVIKDIDFLSNSLKKIEPILYKRKIFPTLVKKVAGLIVAHEASSKKISLLYPVTLNKIYTIFPGFHEDYQAIAQQDKESIKSKYTGEKDYFTFFINPSNKSCLLPVLKAFSQFKKWQRSNMQLVVLTDHININNIIKDFNLYKYREDVRAIVYTGDKESIKIIGSSYALICGYPGLDKSNMAVKGMKCEVPVIFLNNESPFKEAAIHIAPDEKPIAESMMVLYKDEHYRENLIMEGRKYALQFSWENTAGALWNILASKQ